MANTSSRTLRLLSLLQTRRFWPGEELAARLEVSVRTLRRDIDRLRELGYPVEAARGADGGYQLAAGAALPPLVVDDEEAVALAVGLHAATQSAVEGVAESSVRALAKVVQVLPKRLRHQVDALRTVTVPASWNAGTPAGPMVGTGVLTAIARACRDNERVTFSYTARDGVASIRQVEPHRLVSLGRRWYLVAYDLTRHDWRSFRLDRVAEPRVTGGRFRPRQLPAEDAAAFVRAGIDSATPVWHVEAVVHAPAATVAERIGPWATVDALDETRCVLRMTPESLDWAAMGLGVVGAPFTVHHPPELVELLRDWGERFCATAHADPSGAGAKVSSVR